MYIQNLYQSNQFDVAINVLEMISSETITDELLLYRIKTNIKLAEFKGARNDIKLFEKTFQDSELLRYIRYEKKLLDNKNGK
jgi:outer membrane protein assembly factor BamD (BamD/ComL family)